MTVEQLTNIKIEGYRSIRSLDLQLGRVTLLVGANGSGKSNLIEFFTLLNAAVSDSFQLFIGRKGGAQSILHYGSKRTPSLHTQLTLQDAQMSYHYSFTLVHAAGDRLIFKDETIDLQRAGSDRVTIDLGSGHQESGLSRPVEMPIEEAAQTASRTVVKCLKGLGFYHFHDTSSDSMIRSKQALNWNSLLLYNGANLASFLYALQQTRPAHYQRILETFQTIVPFVRQLILRPDVLDPSSILLRWQDRNHDYEFGGHQLSDGSLRALALVTALLQPEDTMPGIILLDEPELGLHPAGIAVVASLIRAVSHKRQVIVSTQSPRFLAEFDPEQVVVVEREEDDSGFGRSVFTRLDSDALRGWLEDYDLGTLYEMQVTGGAPQ